MSKRTRSIDTFSGDEEKDNLKNESEQENKQKRARIVSSVEIEKKTTTVSISFSFPLVKITVGIAGENLPTQKFVPTACTVCHDLQSVSKRRQKTGIVAWSF